MQKCLTYAALSLLLPLLAPGCRKEPQPSPAQVEEDRGGVYVSISVSAGGFGAATKSPTPGEEGDGLQQGTGDENRIYDLNVFFFQGETGPDGNRKGINSADAGGIQVHREYFDNLSPEPEPDGSIVHYVTPATKIGSLRIGQTYDVLVVANAGENFSEGISTLGQLRDHRVTDAIVQTTVEGSPRLKFLMSSAGPETNSITIRNNNSEYNPSVVSINVERLSARVDVHFNGTGGEQDGKYEYSVGDTGDKVRIEGATLVNVYNESFLFKRVKDGSDTVYLGDETADEYSKANNIVLFPELTAGSGTELTGMYDNPFSDMDWTTYNNWNTVNSGISSTSTAADGTTIVYDLLGYAQENVPDQEDAASSRSECCTGVVFKAKYTPHTVIGKEEGTGDDGSFYWYANAFYNSLDAIQKNCSEFNDILMDDENCEAYGIRKYDGGICYYTYWIRHADDRDDTKVSPMEYAIVRNNIYQLNVKSISGIGTPKPEDNIRATIEVYVVNWEPIETEDVVWGDPVQSN